MKLTIDPDADALYLRLTDGKIEDSEQVASGVVLDYDAQDNVVGIEMLHLSKRAPKADLQRLLFQTLGSSPGEKLIVRETPSPLIRKSRSSSHRKNGDFTTRCGPRSRLQSPQMMV